MVPLKLPNPELRTSKLLNFSTLKTQYTEHNNELNLSVFISVPYHPLIPTTTQALPVPPLSSPAIPQLLELRKAGHKAFLFLSRQAGRQPMVAGAGGKYQSMPAPATMPKVGLPPLCQRFHHPGSRHQHQSPPSSNFPVPTPRSGP